MGLEIIRAIQSISNPVLDVLFQFMTMFGEQVLLSVLFCAVYWCYDKQMGRYLIFSLCTSLCLNGILKDTFEMPRPIGQEDVFSLRAETATGHSFPSGHTQSATTFWSGVALWTRKKAVRILCLLIILGVGISRLYLGLHYPVDVLGGLVLGLVVSAVFYFLLRMGCKKLIFVILAAFSLAAILLGESEDTIVAGAMVLGMFAGYFLESRVVDFDTRITLSKKALRFLLGVSLIGLIYLLPRLLLPRTVLIKSIQYAFITFFGVGGYPWLFRKMRL